MHWGWIGLFLGIEATSNALALLVVRRIPASRRRDRWLVTTLLLVDTLCLTGLLAATGGWANPFYVFYVVHVLLAAVLLTAPAVFLITCVAIVGYLSLGWVHVPPEVAGGVVERILSDPPRGERLPLEGGRRVAFLLVLTAVAGFGVHLSRMVDRTQREVARARKRFNERRSLEMVASLAAGAAHELATPLGAIAVAAEELEETWTEAAGEDSLEDIRLIRAQVARCRTLLQRLSSAAGQSTGELPTPHDVRVWIDETLSALTTAQRDRVVVEVKPDALRFRLVGVALSDVLLTLVRNALDADASGERVLVQARLRDASHADTGKEGLGLELRVSDRGPGIESALADRVFDPFFTTKAAGEGMGLGLYLGRTVVDALGGRLYHHPSGDGGTTFVVWLPDRDA